MLICAIWNAASVSGNTEGCLAPQPSSYLSHCTVKTLCLSVRSLIYFSLFARLNCKILVIPHINGRPAVSNTLDWMWWILWTTSMQSMVSLCCCRCTLGSTYIFNHQIWSGCLLDTFYCEPNAPEKHLGAWNLAWTTLSQKSTVEPSKGNNQDFKTRGYVIFQSLR